MCEINTKLRTIYGFTMSMLQNILLCSFTAVVIFTAMTNMLLMVVSILYQVVEAARGHATSSVHVNGYC